MIIGLTGSMASGKSTAAKLLTARGFRVLDADLAARGITADPAVCAKLAAYFGGDILDGEGRIIRPLLAKKAFISKENTDFLNSVTHPAVIALLLRRAEAILLESPRIPVLMDVPLLFESGMDRCCDRVLTVAADDELRYERIMRRDGLTREQAAERIGKQLPQQEKCRRSDAVISNNGSLTELARSIDRALTAIGAPAVPGL